MLGYYRNVDHTEYRRATRIAGTLVLCLYVLLTACQSPVASLAVIDPVFAYLSPESVKVFSKATQSLALLPDSGASAALYATIDAQSPRSVLLSPLLASEIEPILKRNDETRVVYLGNARPEPHPRLTAAVFSSVDAATQGCLLAAAESTRLTAELPSGNPPPSVAAVFSGITDAETCSGAFILAYRSAGGLGEPLIEISVQGFAQAAAERLKTLDIRIGYIAAPPRDAERWARQGFDQYAYLVLENPLPSSMTTSLADSFIIWDMEATLSALVKKQLAQEAGLEKGSWKTVPNGQTDGYRR